MVNFQFPLYSNRKRPPDWCWIMTKCNRTRRKKTIIFLGLCSKMPLGKPASSMKTHGLDTATTTTTTTTTPTTTTTTTKKHTPFWELTSTTATNPSEKKRQKQGHNLEKWTDPTLQGGEQTPNGGIYFRKFPGRVGYVLLFRAVFWVVFWFSIKWCFFGSHFPLKRLVWTFSTELLGEFGSFGSPQGLGPGAVPPVDCNSGQGAMAWIWGWILRCQWWCWWVKSCNQSLRDAKIHRSWK